MTYQTTFLELEREAAQPRQMPSAPPPARMESSVVARRKRCFKCCAEKERSEFYAHAKMGDGLLGKCKACCRADIAANIEKRKQDPEWLAKERARSRAKMAALRASGVKVQPSKETTKRWNEKNKHKRHAQAKAQRAQIKQEITKPDHCQKCGREGYIEKHHPDYTKPLLVEWLCTKCHGETRRK